MQFLKALSKILKEEDWGTIEPEWFDPKFLEDKENDPEELEYAKQLQDAVNRALKLAKE